MLCDLRACVSTCAPTSYGSAMGGMRKSIITLSARECHTWEPHQLYRPALFYKPLLEQLHLCCLAAPVEALENDERAAFLSCSRHICTVFLPSRSVTPLERRNFAPVYRSLAFVGWFSYYKKWFSDVSLKMQMMRLGLVAKHESARARHELVGGPPAEEPLAQWSNGVV